MSKCKYNYNSLMPKTKKNVRTGKDKTSKTKDLEDLIEEDLNLETESESGSETGSETGSESDDKMTMSKGINKMMNETIDDLKDGDLAMPVIGLGLLAIIGFALYKGAKL